MNNYDFDIAISLCKQDVEFARNLVKALNPGLNVFFYEDRQEDLIAESGPESFAKIFKEKARIIVILSRNEWSESFYTEIEKNAIIDRTSVKNQGYSFLIVIPMEPGQIPSWYPSTRIYADPRKFTVEQLVKFIEFKVTDEGGIVTPITSEDIATNFIEQLKAKRELVQLQNEFQAVEALQSAIGSLKSGFNKKAEYFSRNNYSFRLQHNLFNEMKDDAQFGLNNNLLSCQIQNIEKGNYLRGTQQIKTWFILLKNQTILKKQLYRFLYSKDIQGWAIPLKYSGNDNSHLPHLFKDTYSDEWYDLKIPIPNEDLIDKWFSELWNLIKKDFNEVIS